MSESIQLEARNVGVFTGCFTSVQAGRAPLLHASLELGQQWHGSSFKLTTKHGVSRSVGVSSFVDHICSFGVTADAAVATLEALEALLAEIGRLRIAAIVRVLCKREVLQMLMFVRMVGKP